ncbi:enoyl-CoA hydratase/isomerase family protein [Streptomyces halobius]|uniref:Enoyl-CoA hydratase/isomerase family protein n=1 Tax=Streptomyces halobius TaxID=2879846 RepID=A0ABY4MBB0_9ACTN|nr:enoyl-CoA hydratase/isomerase family protein [Streptomyces halobius]UQA94423.1 enoyl-CoA hydratase/isomerase family protein [Streptomyces halobius]
MGYELTTLRTRVADGVLWATFDNPEINLVDPAMVFDLDRLVDEAADDAAVQVIVLDSAHPEFFLAHWDLTAVGEALPHDLPPLPQVLQRLAALPKVSIAKIAGRARGAGSEIALACDMRFASAERAILAQPEVSVGLIPGGGGTQRLPALAGRARALEIILGAEDFDAELAERYGWINRALPDAELNAFVDRLARRIASFPPEAVAAAKGMVDPITLPDSNALAEEWRQTKLALARPQTRARLRRLLELGTQTRGPAELDHARFLGKL